MKSTSVSDDHHFVKHCKNKFLIRENGVAIGVQPWAFELRRATSNFPQENAVSGVYYEFFDGNPTEMDVACYQFIQLEMKSKDALIRMRVGLVKEQGAKRSRPLRVRHEPEKSCLAYASLRGLPVQTDDELCALLADLSVVQITQVSSVI
jgi:hypothetical protein